MSESSIDLAPYKAFISELCAASARCILPLHARRNLEIESKADESPVTRADREAERVIRQMINETYPNHGIIGEEFGNERARKEFVWVVDPIDGTKSFIHGVPLYGTLIALLHQHEPILGAIHQPVLGQLLIGDNQTTTLNGDPVSVREERPIDEASLLTSDPLAFGVDGPVKEGWERLTRRVRLLRTWGDCYGYLLVGTGWADIMVDPVLCAWDVLPVIPIIRGAGGVITDWNGNDPVKGSSAVAAPPHLHRKVMEILHG